MITKYNLSNFKSHIDSRFDLKNLTLITGINGFGKSSVLQPLLLLRQSFQKNRLMEGLDLNSPLVNLGIVDDVHTRGSKEPGMSITFETSEGLNCVFDYDVDGFLTNSFLTKRHYSDDVTAEKLGMLSLFTTGFQYVGASRIGGRSSFSADTYAVEIQRQMSSHDGACDLLGHFLYYYGGEECYDYASESGSSTLMEQTIKWEQRLCPGVVISVQPLGKDKNGFDITYGFKNSQGKTVMEGLSAANVGYGLSYTLPVIVALLAANEGDTLLIENPGAHLHPAGQAELTKLMVAVARRGIQIIVETHSDHIVNGVLLACKNFEHNPEVGIDKNDVSIYYIGERDSSFNAKVEKIDILDGGRINYQPIGFVDQVEKDMIMLNA